MPDIAANAQADQQAGAQALGGSQQPALQPQPSEEQHSAVGKLFHGVYHALGGGAPEITGYQADDSGKMQPQTRPGTGGDWAKRIISGALTGMAAGAQTHVPGAQGLAGAGAGFQAEQQDLRQQDLVKREQGSQDYERQQQQLVRQANIAHLNQQTAESAWKMKREGIEVNKDLTEGFNQMQELVASSPDNKEHGPYNSFPDFLKRYQTEMPNFFQLQASGRIRVKQGPDGVHVYEINPAWEQQKNDKPVTLRQPVGIKDGKAEYREFTIPAGAMTNHDILTAAQQYGQQGLQLSEKQYEQEQENKRAATKEAGENARTAATIEGKKNVASLGVGRKDVLAHDKAYVQPAEATEKSYQMMDSAYKEYQAAKAQGKDLPTGAQSMLALSTHLSTTFGNVKGARVTKDMIQEHLGARGVSDAAKVAIQRLTNGDQLSPAQWDAFHDLIRESRRLSWETATKEAKRKNIPVDFLPKDLSEMAAPKDADGEVVDQTGKIIGHTVNGKYVPLQ